MRFLVKFHQLQTPDLSSSPNSPSCPRFVVDGIVRSQFIVNGEFIVIPRFISTATCPILQRHSHYTTTRPFYDDTAILRRHGHFTTTRPFYDDTAILRRHGHFTTTRPFYDD